MPDFEQQKRRVNGIDIHYASAGDGVPVLLLHGHPQNLNVWRKVAPLLLASGYQVIAADLRGYGDSDKPAGGPGHINYSKREMAKDQVALLEQLGYHRFSVIGHDRGGRVAHRMALDHPDAVANIIVVDIAPTATMYAKTDMEFAKRYFWWFLLIQPAPFPETLINNDPEHFLRRHINGQLADPSAGHVSEAVFSEYLRCYKRPETIHAICEDYRAAASIDLRHDEQDQDARIQAPLLALWGEKSTVGQLYDVLDTWQDKASDVRGQALPTGHCPMEEAPEHFAKEVLEFLSDTHYF